MLSISHERRFIMAIVIRRRELEALEAKERRKLINKSLEAPLQKLDDLGDEVKALFKRPKWLVAKEAK